MTHLLQQYVSIIFNHQVLLFDTFKRVNQLQRGIDSIRIADL